MSKKSILFTVIILILISLSYWTYSTSKNITNNIAQISQNTSADSEKVNIEDMTVTETREGQKFWEIYAESGRYENNANQVILTNIKGNFYKNGKVVLSFEAPQGIYNGKSKEVKLTGGTRAITDKDIFIAAKELGWIGHTDKIIAKGNVKIRKGADFLTFADMAIFTTDFSNVKALGHSQTNVYTKK